MGRYILPRTPGNIWYRTHPSSVWEDGSISLTRFMFMFYSWSWKPPKKLFRENHSPDTQSYLAFTIQYRTPGHELVKPIHRVYAQICLYLWLDLYYFSSRDPENPLEITSRNDAPNKRRYRALYETLGGFHQEYKHGPNLGLVLRNIEDLKLVLLGRVTRPNSRQD